MAPTVRLAGYNVDADLISGVVSILDQMQQIGSSQHLLTDLKAVLDSLAETVRTSLPPESFTPETISAAYARISRDPNHVTELRKAARLSVARARKSNENIVFGLGHASVAEHACFNFDVSGLSRLASEELQSHRLLSFTEKSQRYITISSDFVIPTEIAGTPWEERMRSTITSLFDAYQTVGSALREHFMKSVPEAATKEQIRDLENRAKEDARYLLPLACTTQMGLTLNARDLEYIGRDFSDHPLAEVRELGKAFSSAGTALAPSLVKYTSRGSYPRQNRAAVSQMFAPSEQSLAFSTTFIPRAKLIDSTPDAENRVLQALMFTSGNSNWPSLAERKNQVDSPAAWSELFRNMGEHDNAIRELELASLTFEAEISACCFAQLKRHRMLTLLQQPYSTSLGAVIPPSIRDAGLESMFTDFVARSTEAAAALSQDHPLLTPYLLTNAHMKRVLIQANARELYHIARLRCDSHAQWEIRLLADQMLTLAKNLWPNLLRLACGKDQFSSLYHSLYPA